MDESKSVIDSTSNKLQIADIALDTYSNSKSPKLETTEHATRTTNEHAPPGQPHPRVE